MKVRWAWLPWTLMIVVSGLCIAVLILGIRSYHDHRERRQEICSAVDDLDTAITELLLDLRESRARDRALRHLERVDCDPDRIGGG